MDRGWWSLRSQGHSREQLPLATGLELGWGWRVAQVVCYTLLTPWFNPHQAPQIIGFMQENTGGCHFASPRGSSDPGLKLKSPRVQAAANTSEGHQEAQPGYELLFHWPLWHKEAVYLFRQSTISW